MKKTSNRGITWRGIAILVVTNSKNEIEKKKKKKKGTKIPKLEGMLDKFNNNNLIVHEVTYPFCLTELVEVFFFFKKKKTIIFSLELVNLVE